jgi:transposase
MVSLFHLKIINFSNVTNYFQVFWEKDWGNVNKTTYCQHIIPVIKNELERFVGGILMDDNAPGHAAAVSRERLSQLGIERLPWPPASPDLNPIENIWQVMKQKLRRYDPPITTIQQLQEAVQKEWDAIDWVQILRLIETMPERIKAVIAAKGGHTKW